ncbi:MAG: DUF4835 family protein, partial [Bacteroidota bacterium]
MRNLFVILCAILVFFSAPAQELNCTITVNADQVSQTNQQMIQTMERALNDFVNKNKWTDRVFQENEKINAQMFITVTALENDRFQTNIQVQSSRPVYNTSYQTPIFNHKDNFFNFQYTEFQPLVFNENVFESNLIAVVSYYIYIILGLDADTFSLEGGTEYYRKAQAIVTQAQGTNFSGWKEEIGNNRSRFRLVDDLLSNTYREFRVALYNYHRKGLDIMSDNNRTVKLVIAGTMNLMETVIKRRPNAFLLLTFFDAKSDEIRNIFS